MQKIKLSVINKWTSKNLTAAEVNFLIYISHYQNDAGKAIGIYYRNTCAEMGISIQTFYNIVHSLSEKNIISITRESQLDYDIRIVGNDFTDSNFKEGYINTNRYVFYDNQFMGLKAAEKLMLLDLMKNTYVNKGRFIIGINKFYSKYMDKYKVTKRVLRGYLCSLKAFFHVSLHNGNYIIIPMKSIFDKTEESEEDVYAEHVVITGCRRNKIQQVTPIHKNICVLMKQYKNYTKDIAHAILTAINDSIRVINMYNSPHDPIVRELRPKLIHKLLKNYL